MNRELLTVFKIYLDSLKKPKDEELDEITIDKNELHNTEITPSISLEELYKKFPPLPEEELSKKIPIAPGQVYEYHYDPELLPIHYTVISDEIQSLYTVAIATPYWELANRNSLICQFSLMGRTQMAVLPIIKKISKKIIEKSFLVGELPPEDLILLQKFHLKGEDSIPSHRRGLNPLSSESYRAKFLQIEQERSKLLSDSLQISTELTSDLSFSQLHTSSPTGETSLSVDFPSIENPPTQGELLSPHSPPTKLNNPELFSPPTKRGNPESIIRPSNEQPLYNSVFLSLYLNGTPTYTIAPESFQFSHTKERKVAAKLKNFARDSEKVLFIDRTNRKIFLDIYGLKNKEFSLYYGKQKLLEDSLKESVPVKVTLELDHFPREFEYLDAEELIEHFSIKPRIKELDSAGELQLIRSYYHIYLHSIGGEKSRAHNIIKIIIKELTSSLNEFTQELYRELYRILSEPEVCNCIKCDIIKFFQKNRSAFAIEEFLYLFNSKELAEKLIKNRDIIQVKFPIIRTDNKEGILATAYVIPLKERPRILSFPTADNSVQLALENIQRIQLESGKKYSDFFVYFDEDFEGDSFMLAVWSALNLNREELNKYAFTGSITRNGYIERADFFNEKEQVAKKSKVKLLSNRIFSEVSQLEEIFNRKTEIPLITLVKREPNTSLVQFKDSLIKELDLDPEYFDKVKELFGLSDEDFFIFKETELSDNPKEWMDIISIFESRILKFNREREGKVIFNVAATISSLAVGLGAKFGSKHPIRIFHFAGGEYKKVIDLSENFRRIKEKVKEQFRYIKWNIEGEEKAETLAIAVWLASHKPYKDVKSFIKEKYPHSKLLKIELIDNQGSIDVNDREAWIDITRELYSIIDNYKERRNLLFISAPVALSYALGLSLGHFVNIDVFNYAFEEVNRGAKYYKVFNLTELVSNT